MFVVAKIRYNLHTDFAVSLVLSIFSCYRLHMNKDQKKTPTIKNKVLSIILSIIIALFILSFSIACPILIRQIYYVQIDSLHLSESTGYSRETIIEAYDDMMDYCTMGGESAGRTFSTGTLAWSEDGKDHFDDVERLFHLDFIVAGTTGIMIAAYLITVLILRIRKKPGIKPYRFLKRGPLFWGPSFLLGIILCSTIAALCDFDSFFAWFHHLFFPGKENWLFDRNTDEIIKILPSEVFQTFGIIIALLLLVSYTICIIIDFRQKTPRT